MIGFDFDGTIISQAVAREANRRFFIHMRDLLGDASIPEGSGADYLEPVLELMAKLHGEVAKDEKERAKYLVEAREFYKVFVFEILANEKKVFHQDVVRLLRRFKEQGVKLALLSTSPKMIIKPALLLLGINDLFDIVEASPNDILVTKEEMIANFSHGKLSCYVGDEDGDEEGAQKNNVPFFRYSEGRTKVEEIETFLLSFSEN